MVRFEDLKGKTLIKIDGMVKGSRKIILSTDDGETYVLWHRQGCCESVYVEDVVGDAVDLIGTPLTLAEESTSQAKQEDFAEDYYLDSGTWTFYRLATTKGHVDVRWLGTSNGYYSESVDFQTMSDAKESYSW